MATPWVHILHHVGESQERLLVCKVGADARTIPGWKRVPATRVAMAINSRWLRKTFTFLALEKSGKFTGRPVQM
jgi:hypothetical protein